MDDGGNIVWQYSDKHQINLFRAEISTMDVHRKGVTEASILWFCFIGYVDIPHTSYKDCMTRQHCSLMGLGALNVLVHDTYKQLHVSWSQRLRHSSVLQALLFSACNIKNVEVSWGWGY